MTAPIDAQIKQLNKLCDYYRAQVDFVGGRKIRVQFTKKAIAKFARQVEPDSEEYRYGEFVLVRSDPQ